MLEKKSYLAILFGIALLFGLYLTSLYSYLLFHGLAELFSIVIACGIFMLAWNSRRFLDNTYLLFIGIAYLFIGGLDLIHTLAYKGMGVFPGYDANLSAQLWVAARYVESLSLLIACFFIGRKLKTNLVFLGYISAMFLLLGSIFSWNLFPVCYVEGMGLTPFKKISEYIISLILLASIAMLFKKRHEFDQSVLRLLIASIILTIGSELAFTFYVHVYGLFNLIGHYLKIISFYLIYKAVIQTGLVRPYALLFRDLKRSEEALRTAHDELEQRVQERTAELTEVNEQLRQQIDERRQAEEALREAELRYRTVASFTYDWEYWANLDGTVRYVSPSCERITGYGAEQFVDNPSLFREIIVREDRDIWDKHYHDARVEFKLWEIQFRIRKRDGKIRWIEHACQPVKNDQGRFTGFRVSNRDITKRKHAEEALRAREEDLRKSKEEFRTLAGRLLTAQEAERRLLAREMHDDLTQRLAVLSIEAGKLEQQLQSSRSPASAKLGEMRQQMVELSTDVHAISRQLHPSILDDLGLVDAIKSECNNFTQREGIVVNYKPVRVPARVPRDIALCIYRIIQEGLRNIAKHAQATEAHVSLIGKDDALHLSIKDTGIGFDPLQAKKKTSLGLASMEERVRLIQGDFSIQSQPGQGTEIKVRAPLSGA